MTGSAGTLTISYRSVNQAQVRDSVTVNLPSNAVAVPAPGAAIKKFTAEKRRMKRPSGRRKQ
jgi:hypothetical protein